MSTVAPSRPMTTEEMDALPDNGMERELVRGELREEPMTQRDQWHSSIEAQIAMLLRIWLRGRPKPRGRVASGEVGTRLLRNPDTTVGIDVAYFSADVLANTPASAVYFEGAPSLAVETLSPSDTQKRINEKLDLYEEAGVPLIWLVDPVQQTILAYRAAERPALFAVGQEIDAEPHLPGFRVPIADIFDF